MKQTPAKWNFRYRIKQVAPEYVLNYPHYYEVQLHVPAAIMLRWLGASGRWQTLYNGRTKTLLEAHARMESEIAQDERDQQLRSYKPQTVYTQP